MEGIHAPRLQKEVAEMGAKIAELLKGSSGLEGVENATPAAGNVSVSVLAGERST